MKKASLSAALKSGKGKIRANNEDAYYFNGSFAELRDMNRETSMEYAGLDETALFAICDGMGGCENGEIASYTAVSRMPKLQLALNSGEFSTVTAEWVEETNSAIIKAARDGGCTLALLFFHYDKVFFAHIGDSRIYRFHQGKLSCMTKDHSKLQVLLDAGLITEEEAESYPQKNVITRALGMKEEEIGKCMPAIHEPVPVEEHDRYIICSDGVTDMLSDDRIESLLLRSESVQECAAGIYQAALDAGGKDNVSVIVVEFGCSTQETGDDNGKTGPLELTWTPDAETPGPYSIEQLTTIKHANGRNVTIRTQISNSQIKELFP